jgi:hypothetical protein
MKNFNQTLLLLLAFLFASCGDGSLTALKEKVVSGNLDSDASDALSSIAVSYPNIADGMTATEVSVTLKSINNQPMVNKRVEIWVTGNDNVIVPCTMTNTIGVAKCRVYSTLAEIKKISLVYPPIPLAQDVTFEPMQITTHFGDIVSSSSLELVAYSSGHISNSGVIHDPAILQDAHGTDILHSSFQGIISKGLNP